ncbi:MAG: beta-ketoacyl-ACP synthase II [Spirochaetaceae bacterium]|jgi:3-oxoacyl-[acyl-carrier-protein] synthase II|nr:beta-ketoacyl-ACP synthase II [Spirochaetaceae bacterium]
MKKRVVVTGMGVISPIACSVNELAGSLKAGKCGVVPISSFDTTDFSTKIAAEVQNFDPSRWFDKKRSRKMARFSQFAVAAASQALEQAGLVSVKDDGLAVSYDPERTGVVIGNGIGGFEIVSESFKKLFSEGPSRMLPLTVPLMINNEAAGNVSMVYNIKGPVFTQVTACSSGADALGQALDLIRAGRCDVVVAGGTEACIVPFGIGGFIVLKALSTRNDEPGRASRPFDKDRDGFVMGEGSGILVLESEEHARARSAKILAEFAGYGATGDAYHLTSPDPSSQGQARAISSALNDAGLQAQDIDYYNAHGTSTVINDIAETRAVKIAFGAHSQSLKISSTKSMMGHCIAGAGALEAITAILSIQEGFFPPTINLDNPAPECDLDYVPNKVQYGTIDAAVSANFGFGGHNGAVVFKKY